MPKVSVILPVYNGSTYLRQSVESILNQSFRDFTLYVMDDGSTDDTPEILHTYQDKRLKIISNDRNRGLIYTLNKGLELGSDSEYIARMDADDVSLPNRFAEEINILDKNPDIGVVGSSITYFGTGMADKPVIFPEHTDRIIPAFLVKNPIVHPSVIMRTHALGSLQYDPAFYKYEDHKLWIDLFDECNFYNTPNVLLKYRRHQENVTSQSNYKIEEDISMIRKLICLYGDKLGIGFTDEQLEVLSIITSTYRWQHNPHIAVRKLYETLSDVVASHSKEQVDCKYLKHLLFERAFIYLLKCKRFADVVKLAGNLKNDVSYNQIRKIHKNWF